MNSILAFTVLIGIFAVGDIVANKTKANISMILFVAVVMLAGFWTGILPQTIIGDSKVMSLGLLAASLLVLSLGTMFNINELLQQWRTVIIGIGAVGALSLGMIFIAGPIIGREMAIAGAPVLSGGSAATLIMTAGLKEKGFEDIAVFCVFLYVTQKFVGVPIASFMLKREARRLLRMHHEGTLVSSNSDKAGKKLNFRIIPELKTQLQTPFVLLAKAGIVVLLANKISQLTNGVVNAFVLYLILGVVFTEIGFLEKDILKKSNSSGFIMFLAMMVIFANLTKATPQMAVSFIKPVLISVFIAVVFVIGITALLAKLLKYSPEMGISIGVSCFFGFPPTFYLSHEVSNAVGETDEERAALLDQILPKMLVAGFVTVTIGSVIFAGIMINMI